MYVIMQIMHAIIRIFTWDTAKISVDYFSKGGSSGVEKVHQTM